MSKCVSGIITLNKAFGVCCSDLQNTGRRNSGLSGECDYTRSVHPQHTQPYNYCESWMINHVICVLPICYSLVMRRGEIFVPS